MRIRTAAAAAVAAVVPVTVTVVTVAAVAAGFAARGPQAQETRQAQETPQARETPEVREEARVDLVLVDVIAYDRQGRLVADLRREDFVVREDRRRVELESFEVLDFRAAGVPQAPADGAAADGKPADGAASPLQETAEGVTVRPQRSRATLIVLDLAYAEPFALRKTFDELERFVAGLEPGPGRSWLIYTMQDGALTPSYQADPRALLTALRRYRSKALDEDVATGALDATDRAQSLAELESTFQSCRFGGEMGSAAQAAGATGGAWRRSFLDCLRVPLQIWLEEQVARTARALALLEDLARGAGRPAQPNALLFVSPGFSIRPGRAAVQLAVHYWNLAAPVDEPGAGDGIPAMPSAVHPFPTAREFEREMRGLVDTCAERRVIFHTFDIFNANVDLDRRSSAEFNSISPTIARGYESYKGEIQEGLRELADQTGGTFHSGATLDPMHTAIEQSGLIYTLGYRTTPGDPRDFRRIRIECTRPGVTLHHRSGYYPEG